MRFMGISGIVVMIAIAYLASSDRKKIRWPIVAWGLGLQLFLALLILKTPFGKVFFSYLNDFIIAVLSSTTAGASFVFGKLTGFNVPVGIFDPAAGALIQKDNLIAETGGYFAFTVLPTIIFFSSLMAILYYVGIMGKLVSLLAWVLSRTMKTSGPESLSCAANIFVGQTEAPLVIRPFVNKLSLSELTAVMSGGFATIAGGVLAAYVGMLGKIIPNIAGHLLAASIMSAPAALMMAKLFVPETRTSSFSTPEALKIPQTDRNIIDAATRGAGDGLKLALNVGAMLIAFLALVALFDKGLGFVGALFSYPELSLSWLMGKALAPFAFLLGTPWEDCSTMGDLLGTKLLLNEFVAYAKLKAVSSAGALSEKTQIIAAYALCGFANIGSIGIQIGGISALAPERRGDLAKIAVKALLAGAFASFTTACIAGVLL